MKISLMAPMTNLSTTCIVTNPQGVVNSVLPLSPTAECISALWYGCAVHKLHSEHFISLVLSHKDGLINHLHATCWHQAADEQLDTSYRPYVAILQPTSQMILDQSCDNYVFFRSYRSVNENNSRPHQLVKVMRGKCCICCVPQKREIRFLLFYFRKPFANIKPSHK